MNVLVLITRLGGRGDMWQDGLRVVYLESRQASLGKGQNSNEGDAEHKERGTLEGPGHQAGDMAFGDVIPRVINPEMVQPLA